MPLSQTDYCMWLTGIVGRSMGSGKFAPEDIRALALAAQDTFFDVVGSSLAMERLNGAATPPVAPQRSYAPPAQPAYPPQQQVGGEPVAQGVPFRTWQNDRIKVGKKPSPLGGKEWGQVTWAEALGALRHGSAPVRGYLKFLSELQDRDPKYAASNETTRQRALALLNAPAQAPAGAAAFGGGPIDETPF